MQEQGNQNAKSEGGPFIPEEPEKSVFRLPRKLPGTNLRSSIIGALAKPKSRFFRFFGYNPEAALLRNLERNDIFLIH